MHSTKSGAMRLVWRMTAENQLGEILELPEEPKSGRNRAAVRSRRSRPEPTTAPAPFHDSTGFASSTLGQPGGPGSRATGSVTASSWRASSYDLLQGLTVRDVSERLPQRTFEALFSPDASVARKS